MLHEFGHMKVRRVLRQERIPERFANAPILVQVNALCDLTALLPAAGLESVLVCPFEQSSSPSGVRADWLRGEFATSFGASSATAASAFSSPRKRAADAADSDGDVRMSEQKQPNLNPSSSSSSSGGSSGSRASDLAQQSQLPEIKIMMPTVEDIRQCDGGYTAGRELRFVFSH